LYSGKVGSAAAASAGCLSRPSRRADRPAATPGSRLRGDDLSVRATLEPPARFRALFPGETGAGEGRPLAVGL